MRMPIISTSATGRMMPKVACVLNNIALAGTIYYTSLSDLSGWNKAYGGRPYQRNSGPVNRFGPLKARIAPILSIAFSSQPSSALSWTVSKLKADG